MILEVNINEIKPNPQNPRVIKDDKFKKLVQSIKEFPEMLNIRPIVVNKDMIVLGGNMRLKACREAGLKEIPIIYAENLDEDKQREFIIKDNVGFGEWDWESLKDWNQDELNDWGLDIPDFKEEHLEATDDGYEVPDEIQTDIVLGDLFEIGEHRLLCGDSTNVTDVEKLMNGEKADMVFTSPPYNGDTHLDYGDKQNKKLYENNFDNKTSEEYVNFCKEILNNIFLYTNGFIFWNVNYNAK